MESQPLVSIVVVTYNSSSTIIETLESIKAQTYPNFELIISDDCSKDDTISICKKWIEENQNSSLKIALIESIINTGVSGNLNRGIKKANGIWIKSIAGDDLLTPDAIECYISYVNANSNCRICMAQLEIFGTNDIGIIKEREIYLEKRYTILETHNREKQYRCVLLKHILPGPGIFYQKELWEEIGGFEEKYNFSEERVFSVRVLRKTPIYFLDKKIVKWRFSPSSLSNSKSSLTFKQDCQYYWDELRYLIKDEYGYLIRIDTDLQFLYAESENIIYRFLRVFLPGFYIRRFYYE